MVIHPWKMVILCARNQEIEILGIEMYIDSIHKRLVFAFAGELGSFRVANVCPNTNNFVMKSQVLVWQNDNIGFL